MQVDGELAFSEYMVNKLLVILWNPKILQIYFFLLYFAKFFFFGG